MIKILKVVERPWKPKLEVEPWAPRYALPWIPWHPEWPDNCWVMPVRRPSDMKVNENLWFWPYGDP